MQNEILFRNDFYFDNHDIRKAAQKKLLRMRRLKVPRIKTRGD